MTRLDEAKGYLFKAFTLLKPDHKPASADVMKILVSLQTETIQRAPEVTQ